MVAIALANRPCHGRSSTNSLRSGITCRFSSLVCALAIVAGHGRSKAVEVQQPGEWPCFRCNPALDGHAAGTGDIRNPAIIWRNSIGSTVTRIALLPENDAADQQVTVPPQAPISAKPFDASRWAVPLPMGDIAGTRQPITPTSTTTYADVLPEVPGLERIEFESAFVTPTVNGQWQYGPGRLSAWRNGQWEEVWETGVIDYAFQPSPITGDFDGDGQLEVAVLPWKQLQIYDAKTGQLEQACKFTEGRSYGNYGVYDFDDDGKSEFLVMADFSKHIDVLGFREGKLTVLWQHQVELDIAHSKKIMRVLPDPVADLDGDGRSEVVINIYNDDGDESWKVVIYDALTGEVKAVLANAVAQGIADLDGDGEGELLTAATNGSHAPEFGLIRVHRLVAGQLQVAWEEDHAAWQSQHKVPPLNQQNYSAFGQTCAITRRVGIADVVAVRQWHPEKGEVEVSTRRWNGRSLEKGVSLVAADAEAIALGDDGAALIEVRTPTGVNRQIEVSKCRAEVLEPEPGTAADSPHPLSPPTVVRVPGREFPVVVVQDTSGSACVVFEAPHANQPTKELYRVSYGFRDGQEGTELASPPVKMNNVQNTQFGPAIAALTGDDNRYLIVAGGTRSGISCVAAVDLATGKPLWRRELNRFSAGAHSWNFGGPMLWQVGNFTSKEKQDVAITLQRANMHTEETFLLSGQTGEEIWHRDSQIADRGFGGTPFAIADFNGDGLQDLASFFPDLTYIADGATGRDLLALRNYWTDVPLKPVYWGQPVAGHFDPNTSVPSLLFTRSNNQMVGRVRADGSLAWSDAYDKAGDGFPAVGDFDGDGAIEAIYFGFEDGTRCYDTATGRRKWTLDFGPKKKVSSAVSGDVNGDGRDEAVFVLDKELFCIGTDDSSHAGKIFWKLSLPCQTSSPILADVTATVEGQPSGRLSILVTGVDGFVYCIDSAERVIHQTAQLPGSL
jgi:outer membrane protein assembly factor BamB